MLKPLDDQVVVVTGASSGIGRATALRFAEQGASVAIIARNQEALAQVEREIRELRGETQRSGKSVISLPADVASWDQVEILARRVAVYFGHIDTWVNAAAVALYARFAETPLSEFRRVLDVNLMGQVHGTKAALPYLMAEGRGAIIGVGSVLSAYPLPLQTAYVAAKHALKGFYDALRLEMEHERSGIQIGFVMPSSCDTPLFDHARSHLGVKPKPMPPVYDPTLVAKAIVFAASHPTRDLIVGEGGAALAALSALTPKLFDRVGSGWGFAAQRTNEPERPDDQTNLWQPVPGPGSVKGGFNGTSFSPYAWAQTHPRWSVALAGTATLTLALAALSRSTRRRRS